MLAGDWLQLGPVLVSAAAATYGLATSLLERLAASPLYAAGESRLVTSLVTNYRSHPAILAVPSTLFYRSSLVAAAPLALQQRFTGAALGDLLPNPAVPLIFHAVEGEQLQEEDSPSWHNPQEVWQVLLYLQHLLRRGVAAGDVGVIAPYRQQAAKLRAMLETLELEAPRVGSVEEFQGQERPVILLTTVRSSHGFAAADALHGLGFLASEKRFNVAVTRAQSLLVVVGNPRVLATDPVWRAFLGHVAKLGGWRGSPGHGEVLGGLEELQGLGAEVEEV